MLYTCFGHRREEVEKTIKRLQRKAARHNASIDAWFSDPYPVQINVNAYDEINHSVYTREQITVEAFDVDIYADLIRYTGYTVIAMIEHGEDGNIVHSFDNETDPAWHSIPAKCDHCKGSHNQKTTFIVRHENGEQKQVGKTCLREYTGIDPAAAMLAYEIHDLFLQEKPERGIFDGCNAPRMYRVDDALALAIAVQREQGYIKSGCVNANKDVVHARLHGGEHIEEADKKQAQAILEALKVLDIETACKFLLDNVKALAVNEYCKPSTLGYIAYAPVAFAKYAEHEQKTEAVRNASNHVGNVGERLTISVNSCDLVTSWPTMYGVTYLYKIIDTAGNVLIWYASKAIETAFNCIKGTVKAHDVRDGINQTILTRCKVC